MKSFSPIPWACAVLACLFLGSFSGTVDAAIRKGLGEPLGAATRSDAYSDAGFGFYTPADGTTINRLGYWDQGGDGLAISHTVTIGKFDGGSAYQVVATATVPAGTAAPLEGGYRWVTIPEVVLPNIGQGLDFYILVASHGTDLWTENLGSGEPMHPAIGTVVNHAVRSGSVFTPVGGNPGGWGGANLGYETTGNPPPADSRVRIMPMGDSITAGFTDNPVWNEPFEFGYRGPLATRLTDAGYPFRFVGASPEPFNNTSGDPTHGGTVYPVNELRDPGINQGAHRGYGGISIESVSAGAAAWIAADEPDVILLHIGTNGIGAGSPAKLNTLVTTIFTAKPTVKLVVARIIPAISYNPDVIAYNNYIRDTLVPTYQAAGRAISMVDQYPNFLTNPADNTSINPAKFSNAINHPTNAAYQQMAATWLPAITTVALDSSRIPADIATGAVITGISRPGATAAETTVFTLTAGAGDADNAFFTVAGNQLKAGNHDFTRDAAGTVYSIRLRATGSTSGSTEQALRLTLSKGAADPTAVSIQGVSSSNQSAYAADVKNNDLLQGRTGVHLNYRALVGPPGPQTNDGVHGADSATAAIAWASDGNITSSTYELGAGDGAGYDISRITTIAAWNSAGFMNQKYKVSVRYAGAAEFTPEPECSVDYQPVTNIAGEPNGATGATKVVITRPGGLVFRKIEAIRFTMLDTVSNNGGGVTWREIDVEGTLASSPVVKLRIMPLGDSITYGMGAGPAQIAGGYRDPLARALATQGLPFTFVGSDAGNSTAYLLSANQQANEGHTGFRIDQIQANLNAWQAAANPDVVLLHIGTNDILQNFNLGTGTANDTSAAIARLTTLIATLYANNPSLKVVLSTLIPIQDARDLAVKNYNAAIAATVVPYFSGLGRDIVQVDNYAKFVNPDGSWDNSQFADYAHPNAAGYAAMATVFAAVPLSTPPQLVLTPVTGAGAGGQDAAIAPNLIRQGADTLGSVTAPTGSLPNLFSVAGLNDGSAAGNANATYYSVNDAAAGVTVFPVAITFNLDTGAHPHGYDLQSVQAISGWADHSLGAHRFQLFLSRANGPFENHGTYGNRDVVNGGNSSYLSTVTDLSGTIASHVTAIRFVFLNPDFSNGAGGVGASQAGGGSQGGTVIRELQAFGTPSPNSLAYETWASAHELTGADALPGADPESDGLTNLEEFAFDTDPTANASGPIVHANGIVTGHGRPITVIDPDAAPQAVFGRRKDHQSAGLTYTPQFSAGLDVWVDSPVVPTVLGSDAVIDAVGVAYPATITTPQGVEKPTFFRVRISTR